jgi:ribonuclease Z
LLDPLEEDMKTELIVTGTGFPMPDANRAGPGALIRRGDVTLQFDAGRSTVQRLSAAGVKTPDLTAFFATHHHSDHLTGLQDLVLTRWNMDRRDRSGPLPIVVPDGHCVDFVNRMLDAWNHDLDVRREHSGRTTDPSYDLIVFPVPGPEEIVEVWREGDVRVLAGQVRHEPVSPAVGYRIETPEGAIAITGDTKVCPEVARLAEGADVLLYEAMRFSVVENEDLGRNFIMEYHADTRLIGAQAAELQTPTLILTHLIPGPNTPEEKALFVDEVRSGGFTGELIVADDLCSFSLG